MFSTSLRLSSGQTTSRTSRRRLAADRLAAALRLCVERMEGRIMLSATLVKDIVAGGGGSFPDMPASRAGSIQIQTT